MSKTDELLETSGHTHGMSNTRLYRIWGRMIQRCQNPNSTDWKYYGGAGITVCDEWEEFIPFMKWATKNGYSDNLTIDRINLLGGYAPENCRWVTFVRQMNNTRRSVHITFQGKTKTVPEWAREYNLCRGTILDRVRRGYSGEEALFGKPEHKNKGYGRSGIINHNPNLKEATDG